MVFFAILKVLQDMLQLLKESVSSKHSERLEQIVIFLIGIEIGESFLVSIFQLGEANFTN